MKKALLGLGLTLIVLPASARADSVPAGFVSQLADFPISVNNGTDYVTALDITQQNATFSGGVVAGGDITAAGNANVAGNAVVIGSMTALYYDHTSDRRLKTDIRPVHNALNRILSIRGVEFEWKKDGHKDMGVVAQEVALAFPDIVHTDKAGMKSVEYDSLVGPLIESIRQLKFENDDMKAEIKAMQAKLSITEEK